MTAHNWRKGNGLRFGSVVVPNLNLGRGPYYMDPARLDGYQTLLNFRTGRDPDQPRAKDPAAFAPSVSLADLLSNQVPPDLIADRIVLIGYTDYADRNADHYETPLGPLPGVFLHGQMTSQLISAALDGRPLIHWWTLPGEAVWILAWAVAGGLIVRQGVRVPRITGGLAVAIVVLYGSGHIAMVSAALWIPLVPPLLTFALTAGGIAILTYRLRHP
jgi:CHASE2 domain-containing sensor protein